MTREPDALGWRAASRALHWRFLLVALPITLFAIVALALAAERLATAALRRQVLATLAAARTSAAAAAAQYVRQTDHAVEQLAIEPSTVAALTAFSDATRALDNDPRLAGEAAQAARDRLRAELNRRYAEAIAAGRLDPRRLLPSGRAAAFLQARYLTGESASGYDSAYDHAHDVWAQRLADAAAAAGWNDLLLVRADDGRVLFDTAKTPIFQSSLVDGAYADSPLGTLFRRLRAASDRGVQWTDFVPSLVGGEASAFAGAPVFSGDDQVGVAIAALGGQGMAAALAALDREALGLGAHGQLLLIGADGTARASAVTPPSIVAPAAGAVEAPFTGGYLDAGVAKLGSLGPVPVPALNWRVLAQVDEREALAAAAALRRQIIIAGLALAGCVGLALAGAALLTTAPLRRAVAAIAALRAGEAAARLPARGGGEAEALAVAVNGLLDRTQSAAAAERRRREAELRAVIAVLEAARDGDTTQRAYGGGELAALASTVNTLCERLGERDPGRPLFASAAADALRAAADHLCSEAARHLDAVTAADTAMRQAASGSERAIELTQRVLGEGRRAVDAATGARPVLNELAGRLAALRAELQSQGDACARLGEQGAVLGETRDRLGELTAELGVAVVNAALGAARAGLTAADPAPLADDLGRAADAAAQAGDTLAAVAAAVAHGAAGATGTNARLLSALDHCTADAVAVQRDGERVRAALDGIVDGLAALAAIEPGDRHGGVAAARDSARRLCHAAEVVAREAASLSPIDGDLAGGRGLPRLSAEIGGD